MTGSLIPAATVVLTRPGAAAPEVLMVRRDSRLAFAGGMWVFPGGRIDPEDFSGDLDDLAAAEARAAAREAAEEVGLDVDPSVLTRWSHWTPPDHGQSHRFSTAFFVGPAPDGEVVIDDGEIRAHLWVTPVDALELHRGGEIELSPPTFITLVQLAEAVDVAALLVGRPGEVEHFATRIAGDGDDLVAIYHGDAAYESGDLASPGRRHRLIMSGTEWTYLRDA